MNKKFILPYGKHKGKTIEWLEENAPSYLFWIKENQPKMLSGAENTPKPRVEVDHIEMRPQAISPNLNFLNEGPINQHKK